jgi:MYXO-CTERM domain-containing protein
MSFRSFVVGLPLLAGLAALSGCAAPADPELIGSAEEAIKGGYADPNDVNVVDIVWIEGQYLSECSGSLLAPNMVLTAHHCVSEITGTVGGGVDCFQSKFAAPDKPSNFYVSTKQFLSMNPADFHTVKEVIIPPNSSGVCGGDQAILILSDNIQPTEAVPLIPRVDTQIAKGDVYSAIGFGGTQDDGTGSGQRRRLDNLVVDCVGKPCAQIYGGQIDTDTEWVGDHGICEGDSGGPAIDAQGRVIGVTSRGGAGCTSPIYGDLFGWADWIKSNALHAAEVGGYQAPPWATGYPTDPAYSFPVGDPCGNPSTCQSGLCLADAQGDYCTRACLENAPCPDGYTCEVIANQQICQRIPQVTKNDNNSKGSGCSIQGGDHDPTKPVPWFIGAGFAALALLRRRRAR